MMCLIASDDVYMCLVKCNAGRNLFTQGGLEDVRRPCPVSFDMINNQLVVSKTSESSGSS